VIDPELLEESEGSLPERTLREFAGLCLAVFGAMFFTSWYRRGHAPGLSGWIAGAVVLLVLVYALIRPNAIRPIFLLLMALTKPIGHIIGTGLLAIVYFGVITPMAMAFRLAGRDGLGRHPSNAGSYWIDHSPGEDVRLYLRQYQRQSSGKRPPSAEELRPPSDRTDLYATVPSIAYHESPTLSGADHEQV
jgi:hypothetical protein